MSTAEVPDYMADRPASNACVRCRRRKQKCDGGPNCTRCKKAGVVCEMKPRSKQQSLCNKCKVTAKENPEEIVKTVKEISGYEPQGLGESSDGFSSIVNITPDFFAIRALNNSHLDRCIGFLDQNIITAFPESNFRPYIALPFWKLCTESTAFDIERLASQHMTGSSVGMLLSTFEHLVFFSCGTTGLTDYNNGANFAAKAVVLRDILFDKASPVVNRDDMANQMITTLNIFAFTLLQQHDYIEFLQTVKLVGVLYAHWKTKISADVAALCDLLRTTGQLIFHVYKGQPSHMLPQCSANINSRNRVSRLRNEIIRIMFNMHAITYHDVRNVCSAKPGSAEMFDFKNFIPLHNEEMVARITELRERMQKNVVPLLEEEEKEPSCHPTFLRTMKIQVYGILALTQFRTRMMGESVHSAMVCLNEVEQMVEPPPLTFQPFSYALKVLIDMGHHAAFLRGCRLLARFKDRKAQALIPAIEGTASELVQQEKVATSSVRSSLTRVPIKSIPCARLAGDAYLSSKKQIEAENAKAQAQAQAQAQAHVLPPQHQQVHPAPPPSTTVSRTPSITPETPVAPETPVEVELPSQSYNIFADANAVAWQGGYSQEVTEEVGGPGDVYPIGDIEEMLENSGTDTGSGSGHSSFLMHNDGIDAELYQMGSGTNSVNSLKEHFGEGSATKDPQFAVGDYDAQNAAEQILNAACNGIYELVAQAGAAI